MDAHEDEKLLKDLQVGSLGSGRYLIAGLKFSIQFLSKTSGIDRASTHLT